MQPLRAHTFAGALAVLVAGLACQSGSGDSRDGGTGGTAPQPATGGAGGGSGTGGVVGSGGQGIAAGSRAWAQWPMPNTARDVAAGAPNPQSYADNGDGTVTDRVTGLMWQQAVSEATYTWAEAIAHCPTLALAGHADWRLPSRIELVSLVDDSPAAAAPTAAFRETPAGYFWTASRLAGSSTDAWVVVFNGGTYTVLTSDTNYVRCVR